MPLALDLLQTDADKTLLAVAAAPLALGRPFGAPPGIPADRLAALRAAMMATFKDPAFLADCAKQRLECADPRSGEELGTLIGRAYARAGRRAQAADRDVSGDEVVGCGAHLLPHPEERRRGDGLEDAIALTALVASRLALRRAPQDDGDGCVQRYPPIRSISAPQAVSLSSSRSKPRSRW